MAEWEHIPGQERVTHCCMWRRVSFYGDRDGKGEWVWVNNMGQIVQDTAYHAVFELLLLGWCFSFFFSSKTSYLEQIF